MPVNRDQGHAIARLVNALRPDWDHPGILAALRPVAARHVGDVAHAAIRAALDPGARTPAVIPTDGPHWRERDPAGAASVRRADVPVDQLCVICALPAFECRNAPQVADEPRHDYQPAARATATHHDPGGARPVSLAPERARRHARAALADAHEHARDAATRRRATPAAAAWPGPAEPLTAPPAEATSERTATA